MADYQPLILRAVEGLDKNTGENRRALYERARTALVAQLRGVVPTLDESEITRERLALEEAIRKVEAESARRAREEPRSPPPKRFADRSEPRREEPHRAAPPPPVVPPPPTTSTSFEPAPPDAPSVHDAPRERTLPETTSLSDAAMRGFRDAIADPSSGDTRRPARPTPNERPPGPRHDFDRLEPRREPERHEERHPPQPEDLWALPLESQQPAPSFEFSQEPAPPPPPTRSRRPERTVHDEPAERRPQRSYGKALLIALLAVAGIGLGTLGWLQRDTIAGVASGLIAMFSGSGTPAPPETTAPQQRPKISDRIGQPSTQPSGVPAVAQRVVLYEEDPNDPQGKRLLGSVVWRAETMPAAPGRAPELAVRADVEIPERKMTMTWSLRRNTDQSLPASHTIEIMFNLPADSPSGGVQNVPGVLMKQAEQTRGVPLAGLAVKVTPGFFLIGLSALETDMQRNLQLLKERSWFDIPVVYSNNRRAILAMEKGTPGERAFNDAFAAWRQ